MKMNKREKRFMDSITGRAGPDEKMVQARDADPMAPVGTLLEQGEPTWEYKPVVLQDTANINAYGADGWELVSTIPRPADRAVFHFRRRKQP